MNPFSTSLSAVILMIAAFLPGSVSGETVGKAEYTETTGSHRVDLVSWETPKPDGYLLHSQSNEGQVHDLFVDKSLRTLWWQFRDTGKDTDIRAVRMGDRIEIKGTMNGEPVERTDQIDAAPWYQSLERSLEPLALGKRGAVEQFWVVQPDTLAARKIQAQNEGVDRLQIEGKTVSAARVKISLPGFLALFWSSRYWYRMSDGKFVRFEGLHGPPGTPLTTVVLTAENK